MSNVSQRSFAAGELSPSLYGRTDLVKYGTGLRTCRNLTVLRHGGVANRPGTVYLGATKGNAAARLVKFVYNDDQTYVLEFTDRALRFYRAGGQIVTSGVVAWVVTTAYAVAALVTRGGVTYYCTTAHTSAAGTQPGVGATWQNVWYALSGSVYEIPTPYLAADLATLQVVQSADIITIVHPSYAPRDLSRTGHTSWTLALTSFAPAIGTVTNLAATGGSAGTVYWAVTAIDNTTGEEGLPVFLTGTNKLPSAGTPSVLTWDVLGNALTYSVYRSTDGVTYGFLSNAGGTLFGRSTTTWTASSASVSTASEGVTVASVSQASSNAVATIAQKSFDGKYTVTGLLTIGTSAPVGGPDVTGSVRAYYARDGETRVDAGVIGTAYIAGDGTSTTAFTGTLTVPDNGYAALRIDLVPEVLGHGTVAAFTCTVDETTAPTNAITWQGNGTGYSDVGVAPDYTQAPPSAQSLFLSPGDFPSAVTYYQQRRMFASTTNDPERVWGSRSGSFNSFTKSTPIQDDDTVSFTLASRQVNAVRHMLDVGRLILFTASGEWVVGESEQDILTPTSINARQRLYYGASTLAPIVIGNAVLYVQARGSIVRDFYTDVIQGYKTSDLTLFANHLVDGYTIPSWDFAQTPHSTLWAVRSDGVLLGLTYIREQDVWGWHRHDTDGSVEQVCVVPEGTEDAVYLVVRRTVNGATVRYVERMASRTITDLTDVTSLHFVDCGLAYDGRNTGTETVTLSGGSAWDNTETLTVSRSVGGWSAASVGDRMDLTASDGTIVRVVLTAYTSGTVMTGRAQRLVPADLRALPTRAWAWCVRTVTGLSHLNGKAVSVFADGMVAASPNNADYPVVTVSSGSITLDQPYAVIRAGLPYVSDLETLDIDTPSGPTLKEYDQRVSVVGLVLERTRGVFGGPSTPTGSDPLDGLYELKLRDGEDYASPVALTSGYVEIGIDTNWSPDGRIAVRQVDPLPMTVLSVAPQGNLRQG